MRFIVLFNNFILLYVLFYRTYESSGDSGISYSPTTRSRSSHSASFRGGSGGLMMPMSAGGSSNVVRTTTISYGSKVCCAHDDLVFLLPLLTIRIFLSGAQSSKRFTCSLYVLNRSSGRLHLHQSLVYNHIITLNKVKFIKKIHKNRSGWLVLRNMTCASSSPISFAYQICVRFLSLPKSIYVFSHDSQL